MNEAHNFPDPAEQPDNEAHQGWLSQQGQSVAAIQNWLKVKLAEYLEIQKWEIVEPPIKELFLEAIGKSSQAFVQQS